MADVIYQQYRPNEWSNVFDPMMRSIQDRRDKESQEKQQKESRDFAREQAKRIELTNFHKGLGEAISSGDVTGGNLERSIQTHAQFTELLHPGLDPKLFLKPTSNYNQIMKEYDKQLAEQDVKQGKQKIDATQKAIDSFEDQEARAGAIADERIAASQYERSQEKLDRDKELLEAGVSARQGAKMTPQERLKQQTAQEAIEFKDETGMHMEAYLDLVLDKNFNPEKQSKEWMDRHNQLVQKYGLPADIYEWNDKGWFEIIKRPQKMGVGANIGVAKSRRDDAKKRLKEKFGEE